MTPKELQEAEQAQAILADYYPPMWRRVYENCLKEGFTEAQSLLILQTWIVSRGTGDKLPPREI